MLIAHASELHRFIRSLQSRSNTAVLFTCPSKYEASDLSCTEKLSMWPVPPMRNVQMLRVCDIDWTKSSEAKCLSRHVVSKLYIHSNVSKNWHMLSDFSCYGTLCPQNWIRESWNFITYSGLPIIQILFRYGWKIIWGFQCFQNFENVLVWGTNKDYRSSY